jgi:hypothetical protein
VDVRAFVPESRAVGAETIIGGEINSTLSVPFYSVYSFLARKLALEYFLHKIPS